MSFHVGQGRTRECSCVLCVANECACVSGGGTRDKRGKREVGVGPTEERVRVCMCEFVRVCVCVCVCLCVL